MRRVKVRRVEKKTKDTQKIGLKEIVEDILYPCSYSLNPVRVFGKVHVFDTLISDSVVFLGDAPRVFRFDP